MNVNIAEKSELLPTLNHFINIFLPENCIAGFTVLCIF